MTPAAKVDLVTEDDFRIVDPKTVRPSPDNRVFKDDDKQKELDDDIAVNGVLNALWVREVEDPENPDSAFELIAGERRWTAAMRAKLPTVPINVYNYADDRSRLGRMWAENYLRSDLTTMDKARHVGRMAATKMTQKEIADELGMSQGHVSKLSTLNKLPEWVAGFVDTGQITVDIGVQLVAMPSETVDALFAGGMPDEVALKMAVRKFEMTKSVEKAQKEAKAKGWTVVEEQPSSWTEPKTDGTFRPRVVDTLPEVTDGGHAKLECHAVWIRNDGHIVSVCMKPDTHKAQGKVPDHNEPPSGAVRPPVQAREIPNPEQEATHKAFEAVMEPVRAAARRVLDTGDKDQSLEWAVLTVMTTNFVEYPYGAASSASDLLTPGSQVDRMRTDAWVEETLADPTIGPVHLLHAVALAESLEVLSTVVHASQRGYGQEEDEVAESARFIAYLQEHGEFGLLGLDWDDELLKALTPKAAETPTEVVPEVVDDEGSSEIVEEAIDPPAAEEDVDQSAGVVDEGVPHVRLTKKMKGYYRTCSVCSKLDGRNSNPADAITRAEMHIKDEHGGNGTVDSIEAVRKL